jgi:carbon monoxide dehydrogenase subunit G
MASLKRSVVVQAPVETVFNYLNDPNKLTEYWPGVLDVRDIRPLENGGTCFNFTFKFAGIRLEGTSEDTEIIPLKRMVSRTTGGVDGVVVWEVMPVDGGTQVDFEQSYNIPVPMIGRFAENVVLKLTEKEADMIVASVKAILEA